MVNTPVDIAKLEADLAQAQARVRDLTDMLAIAKRVYGGTAEEVSVGNSGDSSPRPDDSGRPTPVVGFMNGWGTSRAVKDVFMRHPGEIMSLDDVVADMLRNGWPCDSPKPIDTVRVSLSRWMKTEPAVERVRLGYYRYTPPGWAADQFHAAEQLHVPESPSPVPNGAGALYRAEGG